MLNKLVTTLINQAAQHSNHLVALVYPHDTWLARVISVVANLFIKLRYCNFRIYIHSNTLVGGILKQHDFRQVHRASTFILQVMVWEKTPGVPA